MGSISLDTLVLAKKYTDKVLTGLGALKGSPCILKATKENDDGSITVTFSWTDSKGVEETQDVIIPAGPQGTQGEQGEKGTDGTNGVSPTVTITEIDGGHTITITDADGTQSFNVLNGADGYSPSAKVEKENGVVTITITDKTGTTTAEIKENAGAGGAGEENVIEEIKVNGVALTPDENKSVDITVPTVDVDKDYVDTELAKKANIADIPTNVSELQNDSNYQTDTDVTTTLTPYATKTYVGEQISNADHLKREIVTEIPDASTADEHTIYMLKIESATGNDKYREYLLIDGTMQCTGDTSVDLTDYAKKTEIPTELPANGGNSLTVNGHTVNSDVPANAKFTDTIYDDTEVKGSITELNSNLDTLEFGEVAGGKNLKNVNSITVNRSNVYITDYLLPIATYTISFVSNTSGTIDFYSRGSDDITSTSCAMIANQRVSKSFTVNSPARLCSYSNVTATLTEIQIEEGTTATPYEPYIPSVKMLAEENARQNDSLEAHTNNMISSETGVHGMRYFNDTLQVQNEAGEWVDIEDGGGSGIAPNNVSDINLKTGNTKLTIAWSDPSDTIIEGQTLSTWKGTKLVQKVGSFPENPKDGTLILDNQTRDKYKTSGFEVTGLTNGETYYFALFPYSDTGATNLNTANRISGTPQSYKTMTAVINLTNSNPLSSVTYADDAVGMTKGSADWDDFLGYYPVLLDASGNELGKLNPNNYAQYEDGTDAPINVLGSYDVMVAFPKRGLKISTANNKVTISMTDDPDNADFKYYAHSYGSHNNCDVVYVGAYKASANDTKLYSCSGQSPLVSQTIGTFRTYANNRGEGYEQMTFYVRTFLCCAYILRFGNLNSQAAVGRGFVDGNSAATTTGQTDARGMNWGETTGKYQSKCLGIEDLWGNVYEWIDGIYYSSTRNILTVIYNKNMNDTGSGYQDNGQGALSNIGNYMSRPQGTTETGFVAKEVSGSASTYFCDYASLDTSCIAYAGGYYGKTDNAGVFLLYVSISASYSGASIGGRLIKFKVAS